MKNTDEKKAAYIKFLKNTCMVLCSVGNIQGTSIYLYK